MVLPCKPIYHFIAGRGYSSIIYISFTSHHIIIISITVIKQTNNKIPISITIKNIIAIPLKK